MGFRALKKTLEAPYTTKVNNRVHTSRGTTPQSCRTARRLSKASFNDRLEESVADKVNLCAAAASIITGASRYFALRSSLDSRGLRFEDAGLRSNGGGKLVQRGDRRRG